MLDSKPIQLSAGKISTAKEKVFLLEKGTANAKMGFTAWELAELKKICRKWWNSDFSQ